MISGVLLLKLYLNISCVIAIILISMLLFDKRADDLAEKYMPTFEQKQAKFLVSIFIILCIPILPFITIYALWIKK